MGCCDAQRCTGKLLVVLLSIVYGLGVIISASSPNWVGFSATDRENTDITHEVNYGPFYGQSRECRGGICGPYNTRSIDLSDCEDVQSDNAEKLCGQLNTFRSVGILCLILVVIGGCLVAAATCCQMVTCGCCGNSLTCVSNVLFGSEVVLSIVSWSFAIASLQTIKTGPNVNITEYQWGFWLFLISGTILGALATWMADWAADDSCLRSIWHIITCRSRRNNGGNEDDGGEP